jgi:hypothetical protein
MAGPRTPPHQSSASTPRLKGAPTSRHYVIGKPTLDPLHSGLRTGSYGEQAQEWPGVQAYPCRAGAQWEVTMVTGWIKSLGRRLRIARSRRCEVERENQDRRNAEHLDRVREGIKDTPFQGPPAAG